MRRHPDSRRPKARLTVKLDLEWDADLVGWLEALPEGYRSQAIRDALRGHLRASSGVNVDTIRAVVADELSKVLSGQRLAPLAADPPAEESQAEMEAKFGGKLDHLLGSISQGGHSKSDEA